MSRKSELLKNISEKLPKLEINVKAPSLTVSSFFCPQCLIK